MSINFGKAEFIRSAGAREQFLWDGLPQFAFAGRSNVGKSSVINRLLGRKNLAYVGSSPGKTTQVNYFRVDGRVYLVDLPGYGYAKVSKAEKERWSRLMESYSIRDECPQYPSIRPQEFPPETVYKDRCGLSSL